MSMSRKDFQAIAQELKENCPQGEVTDILPHTRAQWQSDVLAVARALSRLNPNFNHSRFCEACTPTSENNQ